MNNKLIHFYHLYCDGQWEEIVREHFGLLNKVGLTPLFESINIGIVGETNSRKSAQELLNSLGIPYKVIVESSTGYEQVTLDKLQQHASSNIEAYYLYTHTKGSSSCKATDVCDPEDKSRHFMARMLVDKGYVKTCYEGNSLWRSEMNKGVIENYKECIDLLQAGAGSVGRFLNPLKSPEVYYYGNFWWATGEVLSRLGAPNPRTRYHAEAWLFSKYHLYPHKAKGIGDNSLFTNLYSI